jgi:uncharacterized membrane protein YidH (DUF202 family)
MEENEIMLLKNSKMYVTRVGNRMNVFSFLAVIGMLFLAIGGIVMLYVSSVLDENTPYYIDNILGMLGLAFILMAGALVPIVVYMRRALRMANQVKSTQEIYPIVEFLRESHKMWKYATSIFTVIIILAVVAAIVAAIYLLPMLKNI